eukprot:gene28932-34918_t
MLQNDKISLKTQLLTSFTTLAVVAAGITFGSISYQTKKSAGDLAKEIAGSIDQQLRIIAESVCMVSSRYSLILNQYSSVASTEEPMLEPQDSYREYHFSGPCTYPNCPSDYGPLAPRSRLPPLPDFVNGSVDHSSVYLYSSVLGRSVRSDADWDNLLASNGEIEDAINGLAYQDKDWKIMYKRGPNTTVMFYLSTQLKTASNAYTMIHRTFPGIVKNETSYDPSQRTWFSSAPMDSFFLYGPYRETFTKLFAVTLSSRTATADSSLTFVSAAVMLVDDLAKVINSVDYINNGFGVLFRYGTREVLVWGNRSSSSIYDEANERFMTVEEIEPKLADQNFRSSGVFEFQDSHQVAWVVAVETFFGTNAYGSSSSADAPSLVMLVFSEKSLAIQPQLALDEHIEETYASVTIQTSIIVCVTVGAVLFLVYLVILYIVRPLEKMRVMSAEVVRISAEEEDHRNYSGIVQRAYFNLSRTDEVGLLASDYYQLVCVLHNRNVDKINSPKHPVNPFHMPEVVDYSHFTFAEYVQSMEAKLAQVVVLNGNDAKSQVTDLIDMNSSQTKPASLKSLDVLSSFSKEAVKASRHTSNAIEESARRRKTSEFSHQVVPANDDEEDRLEAQPVPSPPTPSSSVTTTEPADHQAAIPAASPSSDYILLSAESPKVGLFSSLATQLYSLAALLVIGMTVAMALTVVALNDEGQNWMSDSSDDIESSQIRNLEAITQAKATFVQTYFAQLTLDLLVAGAYFTSLMSGDLTRANFPSTNQYLASYSIDSFNPYSSLPLDGSTDMSGYFVPTDAFCESTVGACLQTNQANQTRLTSLLDLKLRSYFHAKNFLSFIQIGLDSDGLTRYLPYQYSSTYSRPTRCQVQNLGNPMCANKYAQSRCAQPNLANYPAYDVRCRDWYNIAKTNGDPSMVYFDYPRVSSSGQYVLTAVTPILSSDSSSFYGVLNSNFLVATLSQSINSLTILRHGYVYLVDAKNVTNIVLHPKAAFSCRHLSCAETAFSTFELDFFVDSILSPIASGSAATTIPDSYMKGGGTWRVKYAKVIYGSIDYILIATVPNSDITEASDNTTEEIGQTITSMIVASAFCIVFFIAITTWLTRHMVHAVVAPVNELRSIFALVRQDDLSVEIPKKASSTDMRVLLDAFANFMVALRFGSDSYARGNHSRAKQVFTEALELFSTTNNQKGIGASLNNLAAVELALGNFQASQDLYKQAIENGERLVMKEEHVADSSRKDKLLNAVSDRRGNLAVAFLQSDNFPAAFSILERMLMEDKERGYVRGCVVKQGTLGQYYLKQKEFKSAERVFSSALEFTRMRDVSVLQGNGGKQWSVEESVCAEQIALFNCALLKEAMAADGASEAVEAAFLEALCRTPYMHASTVRKILLSLKTHLSVANRQRMEDLAILERYAKTFNFNLSSDGVGGAASGSSGSKRVVFAVDYSGSMAGTKIRAAVSNLQDMLQKNIAAADSIALLSFNTSVTDVLPLTKKEGNEARISSLISSMDAPTGSTVLYDGISAAYTKLSTHATSNDWVVVLTDGEDNGSKTKLPALLQRVREKPQVGLVVIGVGSDVQTEILQSIASASPAKGFYVFAQGDQKSIEDAFHQVAELIESQIILEEY